jgi:hypothetical protein
MSERAMNVRSGYTVHLFPDGFGPAARTACGLTTKWTGEWETRPDHLTGGFPCKRCFPTEQPSPQPKRSRE